MNYEILLRDKRLAVVSTRKEAVAYAKATLGKTLRDLIVNHRSHKFWIAGGPSEFWIEYRNRSVEANQDPPSRFDPGIKIVLR